jgi:hypothetical protein
MKGGELAVLLIVASALQVVGGVTFGRVGRVHPDTARSAVRRLLDIGFETRDMRQLVERAEKDGDARAAKGALAVFDSALAAMARHVGSALADWEDIHAEALRDVLSNAGSLSPVRTEGTKD